VSRTDDTERASAPRLTRRRVTRHDVAVHAGVSDAVVSYTLNGGAPVAAATAEKVRAAIAELGYSPNLAALALKSGSAQSLALIAPASDDVFANPFFTEFATLVEREARARGYALFTASAGPGPDGIADLARDFVSRQVDGLLVVSGPLDHPHGLDAVTVPWLQLNATVEIEGERSIGTDLFDGAVATTRHLIDDGYERIAFIGEGPGEPRHEGWLAACRDAGIEPGPFIDAGYTRQSGYEAGLRLIGLPRDARRTAAFSASDLIALGVLRALHERGVAVPAELGLASFDGSWEAEYTWPPLTSLRQPIEAMAAAAVERLLSPDEEDGHQLFRGRLVVRDSCGPHPA
jgi:LacI family transcriptional regulator